MLIEVFEYTIVLIILFGVLFCLLGAFGLLRLPDVYLRSHAATKSATLGVLCVLAGVFLYLAFFENHVSAKLLLGIVFVFLTSPVAGHLNGRAAYRSGVRLWNGSVQDDLAPALEDQRRQAETKSRAEE